MTDTTTGAAVERKVRIAAPRETVFQFLVDPERFVQWMGRKAELEARPGGRLRLDLNGFDIARGSFIEVSPPSRLVFSFGWESLAETIKPGESRVEITLTADGDGTLLRLVHSDLPEMARESHGQGWDHFLPRLVARAEGHPAESPEPLSQSEEAAARLNTSLVQLRWLIERCDDPSWWAVCPADGRTVGVVAQHAVSHLALVDFAIATGSGIRTPVADFTIESLHQFNAAFAAERAGVGRAETLAALEADGPVAIDKVKAMTPAEMRGALPMAFAGGAELTGQEILLGPLLSDIAHHVADLESCVRS